MYQLNGESMMIEEHLPHGAIGRCLPCVVAHLDVLAVGIETGLNMTQKNRLRGSDTAMYASYAVARELFLKARESMAVVQGAELLGYPASIYVVGNFSVSRLDTQWGTFVSEQELVMSEIGKTQDADAARDLMWYMDGMMCKLASLGVAQGVKRICDSELPEMQDSFRVVISRLFYEMLFRERLFEAGDCSDSGFWQDVVESATECASSASQYVVPSVMRLEASKRGRRSDR